MARQTARRATGSWQTNWTAADVMTHSVLTLRSTDGIRAAAQTLVLHGISGARVELGGTMLGVVTLTDLKHALIANSRGGRWWKRGRSIASGTIADVMSLEVEKVDVETPLADVVALMDDRHVDRVLVVDGRSLVGIVTRTDIARAAALGRSDVQ